VLPTRKFLPHLTLVITAAFASTGTFAATPADARFEKISDVFIEKLLATHPETASTLGDHRYDWRTSDYSARGIAADRALYHKTLARLAAIPAKDLSPDNAVDSAILQNELHARLLDIEVIHEAARDPLQYNPAPGIYILLARDYAPLHKRLEAVEARLHAIPDILAAARQNLQHPPRVFTETAIAQNQGAISLVRDELDTYLKDAPKMRARLAPARKQAQAALEAYGVWLKNDLLPRSDGNFRIGKEAFRQKLRYALDSDLTPEQILASAESELKATQQALFEVGLPLYKNWFPDQPIEGVEHRLIVRAVLGKLAETHSDNDSIVPNVQKKLAAATEFVRAHRLLTLPDAPVQVIVMPEFARGVDIAFCDPAGPLEKRGTTFYAISPTPADWSKERTDSFYREYNDAMLNDLTVHEAMPGHYVQLSIAAKHSTRVRDLFNSGTFVEGWATYAEQFMADAGFGGPETKMEQLKMRLRTIINSILDQQIHAGDMSEQQAMQLMTQEGYQEEGEAAGKWRRALLTSTQLSTYFVGNLEVNALARDLQAKTGATTDMGAAHDSMLAHGSIATKYIRTLSGL